MKCIYSFIAALLFNLAAGAGVAADKVDIPKNKQTRLELYLSPQQAWDMVQKDPAKTLFLDVRTRAEAAYVGMPEGVDALVPYVEHDASWSWDDKREAYKLEPVQGFAPQVERRLKEKNLGKDDPVILLCRSGTRSASAADLLAKQGYTQVYTVVEGFEGDTRKSGPDKGKRTVNGWKNSGLPWTHQLQKDKMFVED